MKDSSKQKIKCFLLKETDKKNLYFRRYASGSDCPDNGYHNVRAFWKMTSNVPGKTTEPVEITEEMKKRLDFPKFCTCGYKFSHEDEWQIFQDILWENIEEGVVTSLKEAPAGAMWEAWWYKDKDLFVKLPTGTDWNIDGPSIGGDKWKRSGTPPEITVKPSIGIEDDEGEWAYHGWLKEGYLVEC